MLCHTVTTVCNGWNICNRHMYGICFNWTRCVPRMLARDGVEDIRMTWRHSNLWTCWYFCTNMWMGADDDVTACCKWSLKMYALCQKKTLTARFTKTRTWWSRYLRPLACWDSGFEFFRLRGWMSPVNVVLCTWRPVRRADPFSRGVLLSVCVVQCDHVKQ